MSEAFFCGGGCGRRVSGIYCERCRERTEKDRATEVAQLREAKAQRMKALWKERRADLIAAISAGKGKP